VARYSMRFGAKRGLGRCYCAACGSPSPFALTVLLLQDAVVCQIGQGTTPDGDQRTVLACCLGDTPSEFLCRQGPSRLAPIDPWPGSEAQITKVWHRDEWEVKNLFFVLGASNTSLSWVSSFP